MKALVSLAAAFALLTAATAQSQYPVKLILLKELSSGATAQGSVVPFIVAEDVKDSSGSVLVKAGTPAFGQVVSSRREGALSASVLDRPARLSIKLLQTQGADNKPLNLSFPNNIKELTRENSTEAAINPGIAAAWKDPQKRAIAEKLVKLYTGESAQALTAQEQSTLINDAKKLSLEQTAQLVQNNKLAPLAEFLHNLRAAQTSALALNATAPGIEPLALIGAVQELNQLTRAGRGYLGKRVAGRNILAPAGLVLDAYVLK